MTGLKARNFQRCILSFLRISFLSFFLSQCVVTQIGNPSMTLGENQGKWGFAGHSVDIFDKYGDSCAHSFMGLVAWGDASVETACLRGKIKEVSHITHDTKWQYFFFQEYCTIVRGK